MQANIFQFSFNNHDDDIIVIDSGNKPIQIDLESRISFNGNLKTLSISSSRLSFNISLQTPFSLLSETFLSDAPLGSPD